MQRSACAVATALLLGGCATAPHLDRYLKGGAAVRQQIVELGDVPFFAQEDLQCGPASLAELLDHSGAGLTPAELKPEVYLPGRGGSLRPEMIAATRKHGRIPYVLKPQLEDLLAEVRDGRPVLVLQNFGLGPASLWHYAVLVGYDAPADRLILRSGRTPRHEESIAGFLARWRGDDRWAMVATLPDEIPATANPQDWIAAAAAFESLDQLSLAAQAYEAASRRWPDSALVWLALGNARYAQKDLKRATVAYAAAARLAPGDGDAHNNYAQSLADSGCPVAARAQARLALLTARDEAHRSLYQQTLDGIRGERDAAECSAR